MKAVETDGNTMDASQNWARIAVLRNDIIIIHNRIPDDKGKKKLSPL